MMAIKSNVAKKDGQAEYSLPKMVDSSGQEWILDAYRGLEPRNYLKEFTSQNVRPDGRPFSASRPITVLPSIFTRNSYGSAMVTLGGNGRSNSAATRIIAACTLLVGHPNPSTPNHGDVDVTLTASPLSGPRFDIMGRESGDITAGNYGIVNNDGSSQSEVVPGNLTNVITNTQSDNLHTDCTPSPTDIKEIESWVRRTLRSSRYVNPTELGIEPGVSAWRVRISLHILNHEGNVWDAALLCACAALADLRLPMVEIDRGVVRIVKNEGSDNLLDGNGTSGKVQRRKGRSLTLGPLPVPLTIVILPSSSGNGKQESDDAKKGSSILLVDPTHLEEDVAFGNVCTVVCNTNEEIVEFHKKGSGSRLSVEQVAAVACMGFGRAMELEKLVLGK